MFKGVGVADPCLRADPHATPIATLEESLGRSRDMPQLSGELCPDSRCGHRCSPARAELTAPLSDGARRHCFPGQGHNCISQCLVPTMFKQKAIFPGLCFLGDSTQTEVEVKVKMHTRSLRTAPQKQRSQFQSEEFHLLVTVTAAQHTAEPKRPGESNWSYTEPRGRRWSQLSNGLQPKQEQEKRFNFKYPLLHHCWVPFHITKNPPNRPRS